MPDDLTPEEQQELENIRRRKQELLEDIQVKIHIWYIYATFLTAENILNHKYSNL